MKENDNKNMKYNTLWVACYPSLESLLQTTLHLFPQMMVYARCCEVFPSDEIVILILIPVQLIRSIAVANVLCFCNTVTHQLVL